MGPPRFGVRRSARRDAPHDAPSPSRPPARDCPGPAHAVHPGGPDVRLPPTCDCLGKPVAWLRPGVTHLLRLGATSARSWSCAASVV
jgi:hypothetical protein